VLRKDDRARLAKIKQDQARSMSKRGQHLGRKSIFIDFSPSRAEVLSAGHDVHGI
jgi:hypothetical protein